MALISAAKLRALLLNTGLQQKDPALYQVIYDLIGLLTSLQNVVNGGSSGGSGGGGGTITINRTIQQLVDFGSDGDGSGDGFSPPISGLNGGNFTPGSVIFAGPSGILAEDNADFFWDNVNKRLGIQITPTANLHVLGRTILNSPIGLTLVFGAETASFPAFKRIGTTIVCRLGDDSGFASLQANDFTVNTGGTYVDLTRGNFLFSSDGTIRIDNSTGNGRFFFGQSLQWQDADNVIIPNGSGILFLANFAGTSFNRIQFGGTGTSHPSLKRVSTGLAVRLADDSADAPLSAAEISLPNTGAAPTAGQAVLVGGTVTVNTTAMTATGLLFLQRKTAGGTTGELTYTQVSGTSFTINSSNALDTSTVNWWIVETH